MVAFRYDFKIIFILSGLFCFQHLNGQFSIKREVRVIADDKGHVNNPDWSLHSKYVAYELTDTLSGNTNIYVYQVGSRNKTRKLIGSRSKARKQIGEEESGSTFDTYQGPDSSSHMPVWSRKEENSLFFLSSDDKAIKQLTTIGDLQIKIFPIGESDLLRVGMDIGQTSAIWGYTVGFLSSTSNELVFLIQKDSPKQIWYTIDGGDLSELPALKEKFQPHEIVSSFSLSLDNKRIVICKGTDKYKEFIYGELEIKDSVNIKMEYSVLDIKSEKGIFQGPTFDPTNSRRIAYVEIVPKTSILADYEMHVYDAKTSGNYLITHNLYRNEDKQVSRGNKTTYVWHPDGDHIIYVNTSQQIEIADVSQLPNVTTTILQTGITKADQLAISPDGKYLAVVSLPEEQYLATEEMNTFAQLYIIELD